MLGEEGRIDAERDTCPESPVLFRLIITFEEDPTATAGFVGVTVTEKSPVTVISRLLNGILSRTSQLL